MDKRITNVWIVVVSAAVLAVLMLGISLIGANQNNTNTTAAANPAATSAVVPTAASQAQNTATQGAVTTQSGLQYIDEVVGTGAQPQKGQTVGGELHRLPGRRHRVRQFRTAQRTPSRSF